MVPRYSTSSNNGSADNIKKSLKRLRFHFPNSYGEGFFYILLQTYEFDCCEAMNALKNNSFPESLKEIPPDLTLPEAMSIVQQTADVDDDEQRDSLDEDDGDDEEEEEETEAAHRRGRVKQLTGGHKEQKHGHPLRNSIQSDDECSESSLSSIEESESSDGHNSDDEKVPSRIRQRDSKEKNLIRDHKLSEDSDDDDESDDGGSDHGKRIVNKDRKRAVIDNDDDDESDESSLIQSRSRRGGNGRRFLDDEASESSTPKSSHDKNGKTSPTSVHSNQSSELFSGSATPISLSASIHDHSDSSLTPNTTPHPNLKPFPTHTSSTQQDTHNQSSNASSQSSPSVSTGQQSLSPSPTKPIRTEFHINQPFDRHSLFSDARSSQTQSISQSNQNSPHQSNNNNRASLFSRHSASPHSPSSSSSPRPHQSHNHDHSSYPDYPATVPNHSADSPAFVPPHKQNSRTLFSEISKKHPQRSLQLIDDDHSSSPSRDRTPDYDQGRSPTSTNWKNDRSNKRVDQPPKSANRTAMKSSVDLLDINEHRLLQSQRVKRPSIIDFESTAVDTNNNEEGGTEIASDENSVYLNALKGYLKKESTLDGRFVFPQEIRETPQELSEDGFHYWNSKRRYMRPGSSSHSSYLRPRHYFLIGPAIYRQLYDYQKIAVAWMFELYKNRLGGILGDEMGLGKTVQTCAFLRGLFSSELATHCLILLPLTLLEQWKAHLRQWCPKATVLVYHGTKSERQRTLDSCGCATDPIVILTTYETFRNSCQELGRAPHYYDSNGLFTRMELEAVGEIEIDDEGIEEDDMAESNWKECVRLEYKENRRVESKPWDVVILDEAHKIKNPSNQIAQAIRLLKSNCRLLLTGTPVSNKLNELWSLMDFAMPGLLGNHRTFKSEMNDPVVRGSKRDATQYDVNRKNRITIELQKMVTPYILRRTVQGALKKTPESTPRIDGVDGDDHKKGIDEANALPPKTDVVVWLELTPKQREIYSGFLESRQVRDIFKRGEKSSKGMNSLRAIGVLQKLCRHPVFLLPKELQTWRNIFLNESSSSNNKTTSKNITHSDDERESEEQSIRSEEWFGKAADLDQQSIGSLISLSGKLQFLQLVLPHFNQRGHRCLLFSQSTMMLDLIEACVMRPFKLRYLRVDGSITGDLRHQRVKKFATRDDIFAMLMTTKVGGQGLNLTSADRVIVVDPDWTPANDNQAVARSHRLGQTKEVFIYRLFTSGAIEDHAFRLQTFKQGIAKSTMEQANQKTYFSNEDMAQMFTLRSSGESETLRILATENLKEMKEEFGTKVKDDLGEEAFEKLFEIFGGLSDFDQLFDTLAQQSAMTKDAEEAAKSSTLKLRSEKYDEVQNTNLDFLRKVKEKMKEGKYIR